MFIVRFVESANSDGTGSKTIKFREFNKELEARKFIKGISGRGDFTNVSILVDLDNSINYKEKFEELYDHLLKGAGIREGVTKNLTKL